MPPINYSTLFRQTGLTDLADLGATLDGKTIYDMPTPQPGNPYNGVYVVPGLMPDGPLSPERIRGLLSAFDDDDEDKSNGKNFLSQSLGLLSATVPKAPPLARPDVPDPQIHRPQLEPMPDFRTMPALAMRSGAGVPAGLNAGLDGQATPGRRRRIAQARPRATTQ